MLLARALLLIDVRFLDTSQSASELENPASVGRYSRANVHRGLFVEGQWMRFDLNKNSVGILLFNPSAHLVISIEGRMAGVAVPPVRAVCGWRRWPL